MLLGFVSAETIGEGDAEGTAGVMVVDDMLTLVGVVQIVVGSLENVIAESLELQLVALERSPGEGGIEVSHGWDVYDALDGWGANVAVKVEDEVLAKEEGAIPLETPEPFAAVEREVIEVGVFVVLIDTDGGESVLPPFADVDGGGEHQTSLEGMVEVGVFVFQCLLGVALVRQLSEVIPGVVEEEACHISVVKDIGERCVEILGWLQGRVAHNLAISTEGIGGEVFHRPVGRIVSVHVDVKFENVSCGRKIGH